MEAENADTRSNDARADRQGGFWFSTMGKNAEAQAGTIYHWYEGQLKVVRSDITIPNAICCSTAYYADTALSRVFAIDLDVATGWPIGDERVFLDLSDAGLNPDGAACDAMGAVWIAMWGASCVIGFGPDGREVTRLTVDAEQVTYPAFGGPNPGTMYLTSAYYGLKVGADMLGSAGMTFSLTVLNPGLASSCVKLGRVDKLDSQISFDLLQGGFCGGYRGALADGGRRMGVL